MTADELYDRFRPRSRHQGGGVIVLDESDARDMLREAEEHGLYVPGIDAFHLHPDGKIQPDMGLDSREFSRPDCWKRGRDYLDGMAGRGLHFEVVVTD